ncbi:hypothetical protein [uncultured Megasphaera sp.]|uniref:hypothetical protein n=1 Tax=uncultured Megasphaera sp. TaxID=165188 RepID=UPI0026085C6A|nr:hypothetical protein [uncultured Megasphaera sp.]
MDAMRKVSKVLCVLGTTSFLMMPASFAAIPVIDADNILQQAKTYGETIKVVTNTAKTLELVILDHMGMSKEDKEAFQKKFDNGINKVTAILNGDTQSVFNKERFPWDEKEGQISIEEIQKMYKDQFPSVWDESEGGCFGQGKTDTLQATIAIWQAARQQSLGSLMTNNKSTLKQYAELMGQLNEAMKDLQDLQEASSKAQGIMQAQQIANDIQTTNARIDNIRTAILAIKGQNDVMQHQAENQSKQNDIQLQTATAQANSNYIKGLNVSPSVDHMLYNPWADF